MNCGADCLFDHTRTSEHLLHHIKRKIPTCIKYEQLDIMPARKNFVDPTMYIALGHLIKQKSELLFLPITVQERLRDYEAGRQTSYEYLYGIMPCGSKACVILEGVDYKLEVMVPDNTDADKFSKVLAGDFRTANIEYIGMNQVQLYKAHGFQKAPRAWIAVHFHNLYSRDTAIDVAVKQKYTTASDDNNRGTAFYYQKIARELRFASASWNSITNYRLEDPAKCNNRCEYVFRVNVANFKKLSKQQRAKFSAQSHPYCRVMTREPILTASWDIETHSSNLGRAPTIADKYTIPTICTSYQYYSESESVLRVAVSMYDSAPRPGIDVTVVCGGERSTLLAHMEVMGRMAPDILYAFNGGHFDWPLYRHKLAEYKLMRTLQEKISCVAPWKTATEESISKFSFKREQIKINAENTHTMERALFDGILDVDAMPTFLKLYPKMEVRKMESLNFFLKSNGLELKEDMPIRRMMLIYSRAAALAGVRACHCDHLRTAPSDAPPNCPTCAAKVPDLDCKPRNPGASLSDLVFTTDLSDYHFDESGARRCCYCARVPKSRADIAEVNYYCVMDCVQPHKLFVKRTIVAEALALATLSYMSVFDAFYRADGAKVYNLIASHFYKRGIAFSNLRVVIDEKNRAHFPGAFVLPPNRGLHADGMITIPVYNDEWNVTGTMTLRSRPITGLDFSSLYPSIITTANFSTETKVSTEAEARALEAEGYSIYHTPPYTYEVGEEAGKAGNTFHTSEAWSVRHNGVYAGNKERIVEKYARVFTHIGADGSKLTIEEGVEPTPEQIAAIAAAVTSSVAYKPVLGRAAKTGERMGVFGHIMVKLGAKRTPVKNESGRLEKILEDMHVKHELAREIKLMDGTTKVCAIDEIEFIKSVVDVQQKAIKVLANTFYGKSGDRRGTLYDIDIAAGITTAGQRYIKTAAAFVKNLGYVTHYGDTDSLYLSCPDSLFAECDAEYAREMRRVTAEFAGVAAVPNPLPGTPEALFKAARVAARRVWWYKQVEISMRDIKKLAGLVIDMFMVLTGTLFLKMAFEEVGYPTYLCGNKKYFLCPHVDKPNFEAKPMIRGIETIKQGQTEVAKAYSNEFMRRTLSPEFEDDPLEVAREMIRRFCSMEMKVADFALMARYKPDKKNAPVLSFVARMRAEYDRRVGAGDENAALYEPPEAGDKFSYVVVKREQRYTARGNIIDTKKGDIMEYTRVFNASQSWPVPLRLDRTYYTERGIAGILARFIVYHNQFKPAGVEYPDKSAYKEFDKKCIQNAKQYVIDYATEVTGGVVDRAEIGRKYKKIYKEIDRAVGVPVRDQLGWLEISDVAEYITAVHESGESSATAERIDGLIRGFAKRDLNIFKIHEFYVGRRRERGVLKYRIDWCDDEIAVVEGKIRQCAAPLVAFMADFDAGIETLVAKMRAGEAAEEVLAGASFNVSDELRAAAARLSGFSRRLRALASVKELSLKTARRISELKAAAIGSYVEPSRVDAAKFINTPIKPAPVGVPDSELY